MEEAKTEIQVLRTTAFTPVHDLGGTRFTVDGNCNRVETMRASSPRRSVQRDNKVIVSILFAASTHPDGEVRELSRCPFLEGLEGVVTRRPSGECVWGCGGGGESDCPSGES